MVLNQPYRVNCENGLGSQEITYVRHRWGHEIPGRREGRV